MNNVLTSSWFYWAVGVAIGLPVALIALTEWQRALERRKSFLARPVSLLRNYLLPVGALLLLLIKATQIPTQETPVKVVATLFGFVLMVLLLSGVNATVFQSAPEGTWRKRIPTIFVDVARFLLISVGLAIIFSYIWGAHIGGLLTALGVGSIVIGLTLQNSVGRTRACRRSQLARSTRRYRLRITDHPELGFGGRVVYEPEPSARGVQDQNPNRLLVGRSAGPSLRHAHPCRRRASAAQA
jgi:hypothetical protein